jgi:hypothetical protein
VSASAVLASLDRGVELDRGAPAALDWQRQHGHGVARPPSNPTSGTVLKNAKN